MPLPEAHLSRTFFYPDKNETKEVSYSNGQLKAEVVDIAADNKMSLRLTVPFSKGNDAVHLSLNKDNLHPGYVGRYTIVTTN